MKPRLSILIPCYRVQNYIRQCLDSIISINLPSDEYEVLCFDDCSPDATHCILDEYAAKYDNIHVFHSAANIGPGGGVIASSNSRKEGGYGSLMEMIWSYRRMCRTC